MKTVWRFLAKFTNLIVCTLHCFDRVLFKGHLLTHWENLTTEGVLVQRKWDVRTCPLRD